MSRQSEQWRHCWASALWMCRDKLHSGTWQNIVTDAFQWLVGRTISWKIINKCWQNMLKKDSVLKRTWLKISLEKEAWAQCCVWLHPKKPIKLYQFAWASVGCNPPIAFSHENLARERLFTNKLRCHHIILSDCTLASGSAVIKKKLHCRFDTATLYGDARFPDLPAEFLPPHSIQFNTAIAINQRN